MKKIFKYHLTVQKISLGQYAEKKIKKIYCKLDNNLEIPLREYRFIMKKIRQENMNISIENYLLIKKTKEMLLNNGVIQ